MSKSAAQQIKEAGGICDECNGNGAIRKNAYHSEICHVCKGTGLSTKDKKRNKYGTGSVEKRTYKGIVYHSILEVEFAQLLNLRLRKKCSFCKGLGFIANVRCYRCKGTGHTGGDVLSWERQVKFDLWADSEYREPTITHAVKVGTYTIDFVVYFVDGHTEWWEVKSYDEKKKRYPTMTPESRLKIAIWKANHPEKAEHFYIKDQRDLKGF